MATPKIIKETKHDDPLHYWSTEADEHGAAMQSVTDGYRQMKLPPLLVEVTLKHPLNKQTYSALLDTGATSSLVSAEVVSWYRPLGPQTWYRNVNDELQSTRGAISLSMVLPEFSDKRVCEQECKIVDKLVYPIVLGTDFLQQQGMAINYATKEIQWDGVTQSMRRAHYPGIYIAKQKATGSALGHADDARTVRILVVTGRSINVATLVPKEHLSSEQKTRLLDLLQSVQIVFQKRIGTLELEPYRLPVKEGSKPRAQPPYSIPLIHRKAVLEEVKRLVKLGVLEPEKNSPWVAPAFVIPKKDGSVRFLSDFRKLNKCLERQYYPLNKIQDLISALDLVMGYYSRVLAEESRPFTAIVLPWGKFRYCRLPMGISTAPEEFHAVMQQLLGDLPYVRVYLDDVLVLSHSFDEHIRHLEIVFGRLRDAGLVVHATKSKFCMKEVEYLGFLATAEGKRPIAKKVDAILRLSKPRNIRDLRRFIGMINYYKDMWKGRSETPAPLTALTSIKRPFQWTSVEQQAFDKAKKMIANQVLLAYPDFDQTFDLYTDASAKQLGGVIMQNGRPLAFWSRKCTAAQEHYTMNKKELLSVLEILREFRTILWGRKLRIFTDHKNSIQATFTNEQTLRWRLEIEEYGPELVYVRGHENVVADALSRLPADEIQSSRTANTAAAHQIMPAEKEKPTPSPLSLVEIAEAQLRTGLHEGPTVARRAIGSIFVLVSKANGRVIVPPEMITKVLDTYHEWLVHPGEKIMIESVKEALTWPGMTESIRSWVRNCKTCARSKDRKAKYGKIPAKTVEVRPWAEIAVDTLGPLGTKHHWRALTIIDTSTRLLEIANIDDETSAEAARIVDQVWFNRYPRPARCIYDQGPEFRKNFENYCSYGVEKSPTTTKNPQANAIVERSHRSINNKLRTESISTKEEWENLLSSVMFAMRAQHHTMTGLAPSQAAFGRDMLFDVPVEVDWKQQQQRKERQIQKAVQRENQGRLEHEYCPEDLVMISRSDPRAPKLQQIYEGPFPVVSVRSDGVLVIDKGAYQERIHMRRM